MRHWPDGDAAAVVIVGVVVCFVIAALCLGPYILPPFVTWLNT